MVKGDILFILGLIVLFFGMLSIPIDTIKSTDIPEPIRIISATVTPYIDDNITYRGLEIFL